MEMDILTRPMNRIEALLSDAPPWEHCVEEMGKAVRDHLLEEIQDAVRACRDHLTSTQNRQVTEAIGVLRSQMDMEVKRAVELAVKPLREDMANLVKLVEALPTVVRTTLEGLPDVNVQVPVPRREVKEINYDLSNRPSTIESTISY